MVVVQNSANFSVGAKNRGHRISPSAGCRALLQIGGGAPAHLAAGTVAVAVVARDALLSVTCRHTAEVTVDVIRGNAELREVEIGAPEQFSSPTS